MSLLPLLDRPRLAQILRAKSRLLVAVSGGADSMALLHALHRYSARVHPVHLEVIHVNHLIRGDEAVEDMDFVEDACARLCIPIHHREVIPMARKDAGMTMEEYFRAERHRLFAEVAKLRRCQFIAVGHNADDLAETFLMHLLRGTGLRGLTYGFSQPLDSRLVIVRPLWRTTRARIEKALAVAKVGFRTDSTNASLEFTRNRVRHLLLPLLEREFNPSIREALLRTADILGGVGAEMGARARSIVRRAARRQSDGVSQIAVAPVAKLSEALAGEVLGEWIRAETGRCPSFDQVGALLRIARTDTAGRRVNLGGGWCVSRTSADLALLPTTRVPAGSSRASRIKGERETDRALAMNYASLNPSLPLAEIQHSIPLRLPRRGAATVSIPLLSGAVASVRVRADLAAGSLFEASEAVSGRPVEPFVLRNRQAGDRISASRRLKAMLINDKVAYFIRDFLIVLADATGRVLGVVGMDRVNARLRSGLEVTWHPQNAAGSNGEAELL